MKMNKDLESKLAKLKKVTIEAENDMKKNKERFEDSQRRLLAAKELLRNMDPEDQKTVKVNDTKLPELLDLHRMAKEVYEESVKRYETNMRYIRVIESKGGH